jgi:hypothetical protein
LAEEGPISVDVVFERFPASVRGAVVVRALDSEPHQIYLEAAEVVDAEKLGRSVGPVSAEQATIDVAPHGEVLIPFDIPFASLPPGAYCVMAEVLVDGRSRVRGPEGGGKRFSVRKSSSSSG